MKRSSVNTTWDTLKQTMQGQGKCLKFRSEYEKVPWFVKLYVIIDSCCATKYSKYKNQARYCNKLMNKLGTIIAVCSLSKHAYLSTTTGTNTKLRQLLQAAAVLECTWAPKLLTLLSWIDDPVYVYFFSTSFSQPVHLLYLFWSICLRDSQKKSVCLFLSKQPVNNNNGPVCLIRSVRL